MSREIPVELIGGPYDGRVGELQIKDEPQRTLAFSLADKDDTAGLFVTDKLHDDLTAVYVLIVEKPRKVMRIDDNGRAHSEPGARYRYDRELSPCQRLFDQAERKALLTNTAAEQVHETRQQLLRESQLRAAKGIR